MAAPLSEKGVELERTLGYFQFNRDVDDEEVKRSHTILAWCLAQGNFVEWLMDCPSKIFWAS